MEQFHPEEPRNNEHQPLFELTAMDALFAGGDREMRVLRNGKIARCNLVPTGDYTMQTFRAGDNTMSFRVPVNRLEVVGEIIEAPYVLPALEHTPSASSGMTAEAFYAHENEAFQTWLQDIKPKLLSVEDVIRWAGEMVTHELEYDRQRDCQNCRGEGGHVLDCPCTHGSTVTDMETGAHVEDNEEGLPDPDCGRCEGSGRYKSVCPTCDGTAKEDVYPRMLLTDPMTGEQREIVFDLARMIREYPEGLRHNYDIHNNFGSLNARISLQFDLWGYLMRDAEPTPGTELYIKSGESGYVLAENRSFNAVAVQHITWHEHWGSRNTLSGPDQAYIQAQSSLASKLNSRIRIDKANAYEVYYCPPPAQRLEDLKTAAAVYGLAIAALLEGYETGTVAYALYLVDGEYQAVSHLGQEDTPEQTIESAWRTLTGLIESGQLESFRQ